MEGRAHASPAQGQLRCNLAAASEEVLESRLSWLCSEVHLKVNDLRATVPYPSMKHVTQDQLQLHKDVTKDQVTSIIRELEDAMAAYDSEEQDKSEAERVWEMGDGAIQEAFEWINELEEVYSSLQVKEILIMDEIWGCGPLH